MLSYLQMIQKLCNHPTILTMSDTMSKGKTPDRWRGGGVGVGEELG